MNTRFCKCKRPLRDGERLCPHCQAERNRKRKVGFKIAGGVGVGLGVVFRKYLKKGAKWAGGKVVKIAKDNGPKILEAVKQVLNV